MTTTKLKGLALGLAALGIIGGGVGAYALQGRGDDPGPGRTQEAAAPEKTSGARPGPAAGPAVELERARSNLARARTESMLREYVAARWSKPDGNPVSYREQVQGIFRGLKAVAESPADRIAVAELTLAAVKNVEDAARDHIPEDADRQAIRGALLVELKIDRAEAELWLAELRVQHPGLPAAAWAPGADAGGSRPSREVVEDEEDVARDRAIRAALSKIAPMTFPNETPLEDVLAYLKKATAGPDLPDGVPIYVDPIGLQEVEKSLQTTVTIDLDGVRLRTSLRLVLNQLGLAYAVAEGMVTINSMAALDPEEAKNRGPEIRSDEVKAAAADRSLPDTSPLFGLGSGDEEDEARTRAVEAGLRKAVPMSFPSETPLEEVLAYLKKVTAGPDLPRGIPIYLDPIGLQEAEKSPQSPIMLDLNGVRLRTTLRLLLKQLGLAYTVRQGVLIISAQPLLEPEAPGSAIPQGMGFMGGQGMM